jgi:hypothetical protein
MSPPKAERPGFIFQIPNSGPALQAAPTKINKEATRMALLCGRMGKITTPVGYETGVLPLNVLENKGYT